MADQIEIPAGLSQTDVANLRNLLDQAGFETGLPAQLGADTFSADAGQVIAPDGSVTYDFHDAHIKADGIDFDAGGNAAGQANSVRWLAQADGSMLAFLSGFDQSSIGGPTALWQGAQRPSGASATLRTEATDPSLGQVFADATGVTRLIINSLGQSHFLQTPIAGKLVLEGPFSFTATVAAQNVAASGLFSLLTPLAGDAAVVPVGAITVAATDVSQIAFTWSIQFAADSQHFAVTLFNAAAAGSAARKVTWQGMVIRG